MSDHHAIGCGGTYRVSSCLSKSFHSLFTGVRKLIKTCSQYEVVGFDYWIWTGTPRNSYYIGTLFVSTAILLNFLMRT